MRNLSQLILVGLFIGLMSIASSPLRADKPQNDCQSNSKDDHKLSRFEFVEPHMGTKFKLSLYAPNKTIANKAAADAYSRIAELNAIMSDYDPESELMRLCKESQPGKPKVVSKELFHVLTKSMEISKRSDGAFDVTVGPIVRLWRRAKRQKKLPTPERLTAARQLVGHQFVRLNPDKRTVEFAKADMRLDLGGIAKGYAGDEALSVLNKHGINRALVDAGGDIVAGDAPPNTEGWTVTIEPIREETKLARQLKIKNAAIATSGDAYQHVEIDGIRYSHIVDPKTGLGLTTRSSVTIIAPNGLTADAMASTVSVLGPTEGLRLINKSEDVETLVVTLNRSQIVLHTSKAFPGKDRL